VRENLLDRLDWVVWELLVRDPAELVEPGVGERTGEAVTELAGSLGCVFIQCADDDTVDGIPYYSWLVRVPRLEHRRRNGQGVPHAVAALHEHLRGQLPSGLDNWQINPDRTLSLREEAGRQLRHAYDDLLSPLELALLGLRRDGAQRLDPEARCWWAGTGQLAGLYTLWLCTDPDVEVASPWLLVRAGLVVTDDFWDSQPGQGLRRFGLKPGTPVLVTPRPAACQSMVTVTTGSFMIPATAARPDAVGACYRWTSRDSRTLAGRVQADLTALLPTLA
jgi:hypothetical protein